ncbi:MAG: ribonuclease III [Alphaproteobacteria bacterium]|nr:ribonuclease III [Alphaproteobacteria bacterium]
MARRPKPDFSVLEARIGHKFANPALLERALTHVSSIGRGKSRTESYQRLEFLGDRVLGLAISEMLYTAYPKEEEGELSRRLADLVRKESCAEVAGEWDAGLFIKLGGGEASSGGRRKTAILGDICEAIIGAIFLDGGYEAAKSVVERSWRERMAAPRRPLRDPKTTLQEWAQARGLATPVYSEIERSGPAHSPQFIIAVEVAGFAPEQARGTSKRSGEQAAARAFMAREGMSEPAGQDKK